jgi:phosphatidylinositol 4-kinase
MQDSIEEMSRQVVDHSLPESISRELQTLLFCGCHRVENIRLLASVYLNRLITSFPSLMCDPPLVFAILEMLNLLQQAAAGEYKDEVIVLIFRVGFI